jgi:toxin FitB
VGLAVGYLLDTNILSETRKMRPDEGVTAFLAGADAKKIFISVLTLGELHKGVEAKRRVDAVAADRLELWVRTIEEAFVSRVVPLDMDAARLWGRLSVTRPLPVIDALIAATALTRSLTLVTRNTRDVETTGVSLFNPFVG